MKRATRCPVCNGTCFQHSVIPTMPSTICKNCHGQGYVCIYNHIVDRTQYMEAETAEEITQEMNVFLDKSIGNIIMDVPILKYM